MPIPAYLLSIRSLHTDEQITQLIPKSRGKHQGLVAAKKVVQTDLVFFDDGREVRGRVYDEDGGKLRLPSNSQIS